MQGCAAAGGTTRGAGAERVTAATGTWRCCSRGDLRRTGIILSEPRSRPFPPQDPSGRWHSKISPCLPDGTCPRNWRSGREASKVTLQRSTRVTPQRHQTRHSQGAKPRGKSSSDGGSGTFSLELRRASGLRAGEGDASVRLEPENTSEERGQQCDPTGNQNQSLSLPSHLGIRAQSTIISGKRLVASTTSQDAVFW